MEQVTPSPDRQQRELSIINAIAQALNGSLNLHEALSITLAYVADLLDLQTGWIWLRNPQTDDYYLAAAQNLPPALTLEPERLEGSCYCIDSFCAGDLAGAANINVVTCSRLQNLVDGTAGLRYHASIPLYARGKELGLLNVASADWCELSAADLRLLYTVGDLLSIAVERARLFAASTQLGALEERNRIAREIHDTVAQGLAAIALHLETADTLAESGLNPALLRQSLQQALALTRTNLEEVRRSVLDLRAKPLEGRTLALALTELAQLMNTQCQLTVECTVIGGNQPLPVMVEAGLYRVAQEALNNICTHAQAQHAWLHLVITPHQVRLTIQDDGHGFDASCIDQKRYGLTGMNERVKLLGGTLTLTSVLGEGTLVEVEAPLATDL